MCKKQVVAAVLEKVLGRKLLGLLSEDLQRWNMSHSRYRDHFGPGGPDVSGDLVTTAQDYEQFMMRFFSNRGWAEKGLKGPGDVGIEA